MPQLRGEQHGHVVDMRRMRGCAVSSYRRAVHHSSALLRAKHMVRRHAWEFHGAGVMDAVGQLEDMTGIRTLHGPVSAREAHAARDRLAVTDLPLPVINAVPAMRDALAKLAVSLNIPGPLVFSYEETALPLNKPITDNGTPVVGWRSPSGLLLCLKHPHRDAVPVWRAPEGAACAVCGEQLA